MQWPDPLDPRQTGPGFDAAGQRWLIKRVKGQRQGSKPVKVAYHRLHRAEDVFLEQLRADFPDGFKPTADEEKRPRKEIDDLTKGKAGSTQYISLLETSYQAVIRIDVDDPERIEDLKALGMPPNLLGLNAGADPSHRGRFQAWWILDLPVSMANGKAATLLRSVQAMLREATGADKSGTGDVNRNPWYRDGAYSWHLLHRRGWTLHEMKDLLVRHLADRLQLEELIDDNDDAAAVQHGDDGSHVAGIFSGPRILSSAQREAQRAGRHVGEGHFRPWRVGAFGQLLRNCSLFMQVSEVARKIRIRDGIVDQMELLEILHELNELIEDDWHIEGLPVRELIDISKKVARYWNERFDPNWGGRCAFYTEGGRRLGTETMKTQGDETRCRIAKLLRLRCTNREISERIGRTIRRVQQIVKEFRDEATQKGLSLETLLDRTSRTDPLIPRNPGTAFSLEQSDRSSESLHTSVSASSSSTSAPETSSRRRSRRRKRLVSRS